MKKYVALFVCFFASSAFGQVITYQIKGKVTGIDNAPIFQLGGSYTLDFSFNGPDMFAPDLDTSKIIPALSVKFNYGNGAYIGTLDSALSFAVNYSTGDYFSIVTPFSGNINFPTIEGNSLLSTIPSTSNYGFQLLTLYDQTGNSLLANAAIDLGKSSQFVDGLGDQFNLQWASDPNAPWSSLVASVDSIEKVSPALSPVPEPSTYGLVASVVLFGLVARRIKRKRRAVVE